MARRGGTRGGGVSDYRETRAAMLAHADGAWRIVDSMEFVTAESSP